MESCTIFQGLAHRKGTLILVIVCILVNLCSVSGGVCWYSITDSNLCRKVYSLNMTKEECCKRTDIPVGWTNHANLTSGDLFYWQALMKGIPNCVRCHVSCATVTCRPGRVCRMKKGIPKCVCKPQCPKTFRKKGHICGNDLKTYRNICRMKRENCKHNREVDVAYFGKCKRSCKRVRCIGGARCLQDQNGLPHCVQCSTQCPVGPVHHLCGDNGVTYDGFCQVRAATCTHQRSISIAYSGKCRANATCSNTMCPDKYTCLLNKETLQPHCEDCTNYCSPYSQEMKICGTDGMTYSSYCLLKRTACETGILIRTKHNGPCRSKKRRRKNRTCKKCTRKRKRKMSKRKQRIANKIKRIRNSYIAGKSRTIAVRRIVRYKLQGNTNSDIT